MDVRVHLPGKIQYKHIAITGSKSETNRLLLLKALYPNIIISNASASDDSEVMQKALASTGNVIDVHHAGTAMRFLTAYFSLQEDTEVVLTGSTRMKERPIGLLVDALRLLGADITYAENEDYPPLKIKGKKLQGGKISIQANVSSQYITALLLIGSSLENGLELTLEGEITSLPYINMTLGLLEEVGIKTKFEDNIITVLPQSEINNQSEIVVESDWSSASYYYSIIAMSDLATTISLSGYKPGSLQGDSSISHIYQQFGVYTEFQNNKIILSKTRNPQPATLELNLNNTPDIAQTIAVTCFGLGIGCHLTGLHTLKIKETDRLSALKTELEKLGALVAITDDSLLLRPQNGFKSLSEAGSRTSEGPGEAEPIDTYNDHRMALAFAPLAVKMPLIINDAGVVSKSYPAFWDDLQMLGFVVENR